MWRYSRIDELELDRYRLAPDPGPSAVPPTPLALAETAAEVRTVNGYPLSSSLGAPGVGFRDASGDGEPQGTTVEPSDDEFVDLNLAFAPHPIDI